MTAQPDLKALEQRLVEAMRRWEDDLCAALVERHGEERAGKLFARLRARLPRRLPAQDVHRCAKRHRHRDDRSPGAQPDLGMNLYAPQAEPGILRFKIYRRGGACRSPTACRCSSAWACACSSSTLTRSSRPHVPRCG